MNPAEDRSLRFLAPALFTVGLLVLALILVFSLDSAIKAPNSDDGYYLRYMQAVHARGLSVVPELFDQWNATERDWIYPPPSRIGFVVVSALWAGIFGARIEALQYLSIASQLVLCLVNYLFARRFFGEPRALFIGLLVGFSTLLMGLSRLALTDSFNTLCMTTTVWLFLDLVRDPRSFVRGVPFMCALALMVLVKEQSVLLVVPFAAFVLYERLARRVPHDLLRFSLWFVVPGVVTAAGFVLAAGSASKFLETTRIVMASPATNEYAIRFGSGPWFRPIVDFLLLSPVPTLLAVGWLAVTVIRLRAGEYDRPSVYLGFLTAFLTLEFSFFTKNVRYAAVFEIPIRVFAVLMLGELVGRMPSRKAFAVTGLLVLCLCWLDWQSFDLMWVQGHGYDPVTAFLAFVRHLVPARGK